MSECKGKDCKILTVEVGDRVKIIKVPMVQVYYRIGDVGIVVKQSTNGCLVDFGSTVKNRCGISGALFVYNDHCQVV